MKQIIAALAAAVLAGCAASTPQEARDMGPERRYAFDVDADYQTVYRRVVGVARQCYQGSLITANMVVNSDLYPDLRRGEVSVGMYGAMQQVYQVIDIEARADGGTAVHAVYPLGPIDTQGAKLREWATGSGSRC